MEKIRVLDISVANKIAAGEVVERPASVIKELVENSVDAGATVITIEITDGGTSYMRVADNGCGMGKEDSKNCFLRHATSKIHDTDDLFSIKTLGFRGEAMASIAAVSRVTLKTHRRDDQFGTSVMIDAGNIKEVAPCGCPDGTAVEVSDLFYNVPARLKFLKSSRAEAGYISDYVSRMILARPDISFKLINNGNVIYHSTGDGILKNAIYSVYGSEVMPHLKAVSFEDSYIKISGFIGSEQLSRPNRTQQSLFVNGRYIKSVKLSSALLNAYDTRIMVGRFPFAVLSFAIAYNEVDVNVHPNKLEVKFSDESRVASALVSAAKTALGFTVVPVYEVHVNEDSTEKNANEPELTQERKDILYKSLMEQANYAPEDEKQPQQAVKTDEMPLVFYPEMPQSQREAWLSAEEYSDTDAIQSEISNIQSKDNNIQKQPPAFEQISFHAEPYEIIGCLFDSFWLIRQNENMFILDQHAAHERMLYEQAISGELKAMSQILLVPIIVKLSTDEYNTYTDNEQLFSEFGFKAEAFGTLTLRITAVPYILSHAEDERFFKDALFMLSKQKNVTLTDMKRETLIRASCKGAIKLGNSVPPKMIEGILDEYNKNGIPLTCPHGRPVMVAITKKDLFKKFKRIV